MIKEQVAGGSQAETQYPQVLIISPTRELTLQIYNEARKFTHGTIYRPVVAYGGTAVGYQLRQLEGGCNILVGTPGRLLDFLNRGKVRTSVALFEGVRVGGGGFAMNSVFIMVHLRLLIYCILFIHIILLTALPSLQC